MVWNREREAASVCQACSFLNLFILVCSEYDGTFVNLVSPESALSPTLNKIKYRLKCANLNKEAKWNGDWNVTFTKRQCLSVDVSYSAIVPVPLHSAKKRERGFNQAEIISKAISKELNVPVQTLVKRNKYP